jgi:two-component system phosphate regulon response regulator PhoB/two-component system alkaline phosphatase synthesis response regulator PhoP
VTKAGTNTGPLVAILDDEADILELVAVAVRSHGFRSAAFRRPEDLLAFLETRRPDLIILDLMLPGCDGLDLCTRLKSRKDLAAIPVLMLTARAGEADRVLGLELGADDYITKPFSPRELVARLKAVLRRVNRAATAAPPPTPSLLVIDERRHEVLLRGEALDLTPTEFRIISLLASHPGWVFSRNQILDHLWGHEKAVLDRTVDVHVLNLRRKLPNGDAIISNVRGAGYKLVLK